MKKFFGYVRVSTAKQGERGVSLQEQTAAIERHAQRNNLEIAQWFEERETAAKRGRPIFNQMLSLLRRGKAAGIIIHKIDRSARNLRDWADLGELIDQGIVVHFANESLDMNSRGGRLSADIQAVVAADYIRNLREETKKGFYGRIKQGFYPLPAPIGYADKGKAMPKEHDPVKAPLVAQAFELYGSGRYNLDSLLAEMHRRGLRNRNGGKVTRTGLSVMLNNPFYIGLIRLKRTGEMFQGAHPPLIRKALFDRVQAILEGRLNARSKRHDFVFRRLLPCKSCGYSLIGESQKGHAYYRCHTDSCEVTCVREEKVDASIRRALSPLRLSDQEKIRLRDRLKALKRAWEEDKESETKTLTLRLGQIQERLERLTDAVIDGLIEKDLFERRKETILMERRKLEETLAEMKTGRHSLPLRVSKFLELAGSAYFLYESGLKEEKRQLLRLVTSNRQVCGKTLALTLAQPFREVANRAQNINRAPYRYVPRTLDHLLDFLWRWFKENPTATIGASLHDFSHPSKPGEGNKGEEVAAG